MLLMIDNYDSFTYNLVQYLAEIGQEVEVVRNDKISIEEINKLNPRYIVISCLLYTSPSPRDKRQSRMPSSA